MLLLVVRFLLHGAADDREGGADRVLVRVVARSEDEATTTTRLVLLIQHRFLQEHVLLTEGGLSFRINVFIYNLFI